MPGTEGRPNYGRAECLSEEAAAAAIDSLLSEGGTLLWHRYLARKAYGFATEAATSLMLGQIQMSFVAHDDERSDTDEVWDLEEEPDILEIDSWARMHLAVRKQEGNQAASGSKSKTAAMVKAHQAARNRTSDTKPKPILKDPREREPRAAAQQVKVDKSETRASPIIEELHFDEWEEQLRNSKIEEEAKRRDKERKARESERTREEDRRRIAERHEEMDKRPHTFDTEGNIIWMEDIKTDRLPRVQEAFGYHIKRDAKNRTAGLDDTLRATMSKESTGKESVIKDKSRRSRGMRGTMRFDKGSKSERLDAEFTDTFSKLQHGQPPILETMTVQPGVVLEAMGKKKAGTEALLERHVMSRKEYNALAERDVLLDYRGSAAAAGASGGESPPGKAGPADHDGDALGGHPTPGHSPNNGAGAPLGVVGASGAAAAERGAALLMAPGGPRESFIGAVGGLGLLAPGGLLPPLRSSVAGQGPGGGAKGRSNSTARGPGDPDAPPVQKAPPAPPPSLRHMGKKFEALGAVAFQRAPRYHVPMLGGPHGFGAAQPPLGATMGHGLVRNGSLKEEYFFPPQMPELPLIHKSASEASFAGGFGRMGIGSAGGNSSRGGGGAMNTPKGTGTPKA